MRIRSSKRKSVIIPIAEKPAIGCAPSSPDFKVEGEVDAPTFKKAIEQVKETAKHSSLFYGRDGRFKKAKYRYTTIEKHV